LKKSFDPTELYRNFYTERLAECQQGKVPDQKENQKNITIVGAGMSGLISAWILAKAGHNINLLESSNVAGGRIKTLRHPFTDGFFAEAGAMRIPKSHEITMRILKTVLEFKDDKTKPNDPDLINFPHKDQNTIMFFNNVSTTRRQYKVSPESFNYTGLADNEKKKSAEQIFQKCVTNYIEFDTRKDDSVRAWRDHLPVKEQNPGGLFTLIGKDTSGELKAWNKALMTCMDKLSFRNFLKENCYLERYESQKTPHKISDAAANLVASVLVYDMHYPSSMAAILGDYSELSEDEYWQIDKGMDRLPLEMAKRVLSLPNTRILYNTRVTEIKPGRSEDNALDVSYENTVSRVSDNLPPQDLVILSLPFSALRHINTKSLMSTDKRRAVRQLHYDNSCKILIEFRRRFWEETYKITQGGSSITDLPVRQIHYPGQQQNRGERGNGLLLASYTWGEDSLRWTSLKADDRIRFALDDLTQVHPMVKCDLHKLCSGGFSHSWAEHEFTSGAFAMFEPFQMTELFSHIWKPEGRVHYCGEHTSTKQGWIEGAVESGIRVAFEIIHRVDHPNGFSSQNTAAAAPATYE
jgi:monoamine oxidase